MRRTLRVDHRGREQPNGERGYALHFGFSVDVQREVFIRGLD